MTQTARLEDAPRTLIFVDVLGFDAMTGGKGWRLATMKGRKRVFVGTLLGTLNLRKRRIAMFSVPK